MSFFPLVLVLMLATFTVNDAVLTTVPAMVSDPWTLLVRPITVS